MQNGCTLKPLEDGQIIRSGYMKKVRVTAGSDLSFRVGRIVKRFVVLKQDVYQKPACLEYYKDKKKFLLQERANHLVELKNVFNVNKSVYPGMSHCITIFGQCETIFFGCDSKDDSDIWFSSIFRCFINTKPGNQEDNIKSNYDHVFDVILPKENTNSSDINRHGRQRLCITDEHLVFYSFPHDFNATPFHYPRNCISTYGIRDEVVIAMLGRISGSGQVPFEIVNSTLALELHSLLLSKKVTQQGARLRSSSDCSSVEAHARSIAGICMSSGASSSMAYSAADSFATPRTRTSSDVSSKSRPKSGSFRSIIELLSGRISSGPTITRNGNQTARLPVVLEIGGSGSGEGAVPSDKTGCNSRCTNFGSGYTPMNILAQSPAQNVGLRARMAEVRSYIRCTDDSRGPTPHNRAYSVGVSNPYSRLKDAIEDQDQQSQNAFTFSSTNRLLATSSGDTFDDGLAIDQNRRRNTDESFTPSVVIQAQVESPPSVIQLNLQTQQQSENRKRALSWGSKNRSTAPENKMRQLTRIVREISHFGRSDSQSGSSGSTSRHPTGSSRHSTISQDHVEMDCGAMSFSRRRPTQDSAKSGDHPLKSTEQRRIRADKFVYDSLKSDKKNELPVQTDYMLMQQTAQPTNDLSAIVHIGKTAQEPIKSLSPVDTKLSTVLIQKLTNDNDPYVPISYGPRFVSSSVEPNLKPIMRHTAQFNVRKSYMPMACGDLDHLPSTSSQNIPSCDVLSQRTTSGRNADEYVLLNRSSLSAPSAHFPHSSLDIPMKDSHASGSIPNLNRPADNDISALSINSTPMGKVASVIEEIDVQLAKAFVSNNNHSQQQEPSIVDTNVQSSNNTTFFDPLSTAS